MQHPNTHTESTGELSPETNQTANHTKESIEDKMLKLGVMIEQARGIVSLIANDSQGLEFSTPVKDIYLALTGVEMILTLADSLETEISQQLHTMGEV